jgi:hypothetical protein
VGAGVNRSRDLRGWLVDQPARADRPSGSRALEPWHVGCSRPLAVMSIKVVLAAAVVTTTGCLGPDYDELAIECEGKCDGLSSIRALVSDARELDLQDLINVGAGYATEELDDQLDLLDFVSFQLRPTELYAPAHVAAEDLTLKDLDGLVSGLASRYGESALTTEVNAVRRRHLETTGKRVYAEAAFRLDAALGHSWSVPAAGFDGGSITLGFDAGADLEARVITAHRSENGGLVGAPLAAIRASRGFVLPRSLDDVRAMAAGESFALSGRGRLGLNLGAGVPILIANPTSWLTYSLVVTAGLRSAFEGDVDIQLVRLEGDEVVVDVGVEAAGLIHGSIALRDGWGIQGLIETHVSIGPVNVDLGELLDKALQQKVASKLSLIRAAAERTQTSMRMSVARLRFRLDASDPTGGRAQALAQALRGDLRLAQALAARGDAGVVADFDMVRSGASAISYAGVDVLGMSFYRRAAESEGDAVIQTPGGVLSLLWESLHRESGWFFSSHGYTRIGVAGLRFDAREPGVAFGETNLFLQTQEGDEFMERDKVIDQLDSLIVAVGGKDALRAIEQRGNELERLIVARCPLPETGEYYDESCNVGLNGDPDVIALRAAALADLDAAIAGLPPDTRDLIHAVGDLRLAAQSIADPVAAAVGPTASMVANFRLDDAALRAVLTRDKLGMKSAVLALMDATQLDRYSTDPAGERTAIRDRSQATADRMGAVFQRHADDYQRLLSIDGASIETLGKIGANAIEVRFPVDSRNRAKYADAVASSVAQSRARVVGDLFEALRAEADDMPGSGGSRAPHPEQLAAFALLALSPPAHVELRVDFKTDNDSCSLCGDRERYDAAGFAGLDRYARGPDASPIAAGLFDIDAIIAAPR